MSGKPADQDASVSMVSTSEISAVDRLTSEWMAGVMRLPHGISLTSTHLLNACINVHANIGLSLAVDIPRRPAEADELALDAFANLERAGRQVVHARAKRAGVLGNDDGGAAVVLSQI